MFSLIFSLLLCDTWNLGHWSYLHRAAFPLVSSEPSGALRKGRRLTDLL